MSEPSCQEDDDKCCSPVSPDQFGAEPEMDPPTLSHPPSINSLAVSQCYASRSEIKDIIKTASIRDGWSFYCLKSNYSRYTVRCKEPSCSWYLHASCARPGAPFVIKVYRPQHTCYRQRDESAGVASSQWIARRILPAVLVDRNISPSDLIARLRSTHGVTVTYKQAWRAREVALRLLSNRANCIPVTDATDRFCALLDQRDQFSHASCELWDPVGRGALLPDPSQCNFRRMFWTYSAALNAFLHCRQVIVLDLQDRKVQNDDVMWMVAAARDAEDNMVPIAFAVLRLVLPDTWDWFLNNLRVALVKFLCGNRPTWTAAEVCDFVRNIIFVSNKQGGAAEGVARVFPENAPRHSLCLHYLYTQVNTKYGRREAETVTRAAYAYTEASFNNILEHGLTASQRDWLLTRYPPVEWAESMFPGNRRGVMDANLLRMIVEWEFVTHQPVRVQGRLLPADFIRKDQSTIAFRSSYMMGPAVSMGLSKLFESRRQRAIEYAKQHPEQVVTEYVRNLVTSALQRMKSRVLRVESTTSGSIFRVRIGENMRVEGPSSSADGTMRFPLVTLEDVTDELGAEASGTSSCAEHREVDFKYAEYAQELQAMLRAAGFTEDKIPHETSSDVALRQPPGDIESAATSTEPATDVVVDLNLRHCSCMAWSKNGLPCEHVLAVLQMIRKTSLEGGNTDLDAFEICGGAWLFDPMFTLDVYQRCYEMPVEIVSDSDTFTFV